MNKILIIGAGVVSNVVTQKCAMVPEVFSEIMLASRTLSKCKAIAKSVAQKQKRRIQVAQLDADSRRETVRLIEKFQPALVINVALPYQDLAIMDACLHTGVHYLDTANYEPKDRAKFTYKWQWAYQKRYRQKGIMALLGCGFDPGVTGVFTAYAQKHHFDQIHELDIVDCNAGEHGQAFATNFNPEINIREITQKGRYWANGQWIEVAPLSIHKAIDYPNIGLRDSYLLYHEELESLTKNISHLKSARFWMTFSKEYITHLRVLQNVGMTSIKPIAYEGKEIIPLQFLKALLPDPSDLAANYTGQTSIGCQFKGIKDGQQKYYYLYNNCDHAQAYRQVGTQAVAYTAGVPAMIGAMMMLKGEWMRAGVYNLEEFDPDNFMQALNQYGLPWYEQMSF